MHTDVGPSKAYEEAGPRVKLPLGQRDGHCHGQSHQVPVQPQVLQWPQLAQLPQ